MQDNFFLVFVDRPAFDPIFATVKERADSRIISKMAKPRKFPSDIYKYFIITKSLKECDLESQDRFLSVVSDPRS